ncbi:tRNA (adenosine(37)-N6)-dimethylallyltransferase MiaA [Acholeplasma granularum]|uniref:tRNA (adenosine(37)-N6)-dimethylallyltransferase MiaA n=1 Tax=Acholeplasma granularum TaxID=264635 RepID=UPI0004AD03CD|nr:tRNA (adenosine(37)-N6)-dimethylallyltransferase MiaA [Acholeplasma granularum]
MRKVISIVGPTGTGKSRLAIQLAKMINAEVINGDSVSIYKELNIGSAKTLKNEQENINHHLIDKVSLDENYTIFDFQRDVRYLIEKINTPIIVGGSGLYIKSALYDYKFEQQIHTDLKTINEMIDFIQKNDPKAIIDINNPRRIESAYKQLINGSKRSDKQNKNTPLYDIHLIYLEIDRDLLRTRLEKRLESMLENGFIEETKSLINYELNIIGYRELKSYLLGECSLEDAKKNIITSTMRFAKRQKTWFLNQMTPHIYNALDDNLLIKVYEDVTKFLGEKRT